MHLQIFHFSTKTRVDLKNHGQYVLGSINVMLFELLRLTWV